MRKYYVVLCCWLIGSSALSQEYQFKDYGVERGLPSDIIKGCSQDSLGYLWAATDEGLVKYDGIKFTNYRGAMHSNYAKGLFTTRTGRLLAFGDLDLIEIKNLGDTVLFTPLCPVNRNPSDTALSYPKSIFEDNEDNLWLSESQSVVRITRTGIKRYDFDATNRSPQFLRSFAFFEDQRHNLFVTSFPGNVFRYNKRADTFEPASFKFPVSVEFVSVFENKLIVGAADGVYEGNLLSEGGAEDPELKMKISLVCYIASIGDDKYFIATRGTQHFIGDFKDYSFVPVAKTINNINHVYRSTENDIWLSCNEGLIIMRKNLFQGINEHVSDFIEAITEDTVSGNIYYATSPKLFSYDPVKKTNTVLLDIPAGYFQSLLYTKDGVWAANAFTVFLLDNGKIKKQFDFSKNNLFVTELAAGSSGSVWVSIPGDRSATMIDASLKVRRVSVPLNGEGVINLIREGSNGTYIASVGKKSYLYFKSKSDSVFQNISVPINFDTRGEFNAVDLLVKGDTVWLATTEGLLRFYDHTIEKTNLGDQFNGLPVSSVRLYSGNRLLLSTPHGVVLYDPQTGSHDLFNQSSGLLSNTITYHGIFVTKNQAVWLGTAKGICFSIRSLIKLNKSARPRFLDFYANGRKITHALQNRIAYGSFLSIQVSCIMSPDDEITFQYRVLPAAEWKTAPRSEIQLSSLSSGAHQLEVRAKKNGPYSWSNPTRTSFTIVKPFWELWWFYLLCLVGGAIVIGATFIGVNARNERKNKELQSLIDERTAELKLSNENLIEINLEKNNLIEIVAHDLKSPLNQISGLLSLVKMTGKLDPEAASYLVLMEKSASRLNEMIVKILNVDAIESRNLNVKTEKIILSDALESVAARHDREAALKNIVISRRITPGVSVLADKAYIEQIFENLISNAIKFSHYDRKVFVNLDVRDGKAVCEISDEGPGFVEEDLKKLFGKYQKLSARPTGNEISTGLGLSIVKKYVAAMNGEIWCKSRMGEGASFFVSFFI